MSDPNFILLYVKSPATSAAFYAGLLGKPPVEAWQAKGLPVAQPPTDMDFGHTFVAPL